MNRTAPDAAPRTHRPPGRGYAALAILAVVLSGCSTAPPTAAPTTTMTLATGADAGTASSGPGVQVNVETGVPEAVVSFSAGASAVAATAVGVQADEVQADEVRRGEDGDLLVVTWGSTTCPRMPATVTAVDLTTVDIVTGTVRVGPDPAAPVSETFVCTTDLGPTTSTVRLPEGAAGAGPLTVVVDGVRYALA